MHIKELCKYEDIEITGNDSKKINYSPILILLKSKPKKVKIKWHKKLVSLYPYYLRKWGGGEGLLI